MMNISFPVFKSIFDVEANNLIAHKNSDDF